MLAGAIAGGLLGAAFDQVTITISPAYFVLGKGLSVPPADLRAAAGWLGFRGGLALGALTVGGGLWLEARGASVRWPRLVLGVCAWAFGSALVVAVLMRLVDPFDIHEQSAGVLDALEASRYLTAWGAHMGAHAGVIGSVTAVLARARGRSLASPATGAPGAPPCGRRPRGRSEDWRAPSRRCAPPGRA